jgi:hypothetical protein
MPHGDQLLPDCGQRTHPEVSIKEGPNDKLLLKNLTGIVEPVYFAVAQWFPFVLVGHRLTRSVGGNLKNKIPKQTSGGDKN